MKLSISKMDIVPIITSVLFFSWITLWVIALLIGWIPLDLTRLFYFLIPIPWIILIIIVWINWKNVYKKIKISNIAFMKFKIVMFKCFV